MMALARYPVDDDLLDRLRNCRIVVQMGSGYDNVDLESATRCGVVVTNMPGTIAEDVSDHAIALMLGCLRQVGQRDRALRRGIWDPALIAAPKRLRGQTLGVVGFGRIGRMVVQKTAGFGLKHATYDPYVARESAESYGVELVSFEELLQCSDIVTVHLPATDETRKMFGERAFSLIGPSAIFVNTARGHVVDEKALCAALSDGRVLAAGLDVFENEPLAPDSPLLQMDNVLMTPHIGGCSTETVNESFSLAYQLVSGFLVEGKIPEWILNPGVLSVQLER
jgi:D-3-phosphoglycerate dehydrogenase